MPKYESNSDVVLFGNKNEPFNLPSLFEVYKDHTHSRAVSVPSKINGSCAAVTNKRVIPIFTNTAVVIYG